MQNAAIMKQAPYGSISPTTEDKARRAAFLLGLGVILLATTVLSSGWWGNIPTLLSVVPDAPTMKANTAFALICCALATTILASTPGSGARWMAAVLASMALLVCVLTSFEILTGIDLGIDQLLVEDNRSPYAPPGQMSAATATSGILAAGALLTTGTGSPLLLRLRIIFSIIGAVIAALAAYIYIFEVRAILDVPFLATMSLPTAVSFLALFAAATLLDPFRGIGAVFLAEKASSMIGRQLLLPIVLLPLLVGVTVTTAIDQPAVSMAVMAGANTVILCIITVTVARRIDEYDQRQRELHDRSVDLMEQATAANAAKTRFLASVSHDLRTPLNAIIGFSEIMRSERFGPIRNPQYKEYAAHIHGSGEVLLTTINSILDVARVEAGLVAVNDEPCAIREIAQSICVEAANANGNSGIRLLNRAPAQAHPLLADPVLLRRMISNLVENAIKFTPPGGEISVESFVDGSGATTIVVRDNGIGFDPTQVDRLIEAFEQESQEALVAKSSGGMGLGLAIVKNLATLHHAQVVITSETGRGTQVDLVFPAHRTLVPGR